MEKKNTGLIVVIVILSLLVVGLGGFIVYDEVLKEEPKCVEIAEDENKNNNSGTANKIYDISEINFDDKCDGINYNDNVCTLKYKNYNFEIGKLIKDNNWDGEYLKINNKVILDKEFYISRNITIIDGVAIITTSGSDIRNNVIYAFDYNGTQLLKVYELDSKYPSMVVTTSDKLYNIKDNKLIIEGSRMSHGLVIIDGNEQLEICYNNDINSNEIVSGTYEVEYLGNQKFSQIKNIKYTNLKDSNLLNECNK